jgi:PST family polysaccharide transporter
MQEAGATRQETDSYRDILLSTALIGGSNFISMALLLVRMKTLALLLGPAGVGLVAMFSSIADLVVALAGMGVNQSGVRQIAQANGSGESSRIAATMLTLRRTSLVLGLAGGIGLAVLAVPATMLTFGSAEYSVAVALLGLVVLLRILTGGQTALLQGSRRVSELAWLNIGTAAASVAVTVPLVIVWGEAAIVPALVLTAVVTWIVAQWLVQRVQVPAETASGPVRVGEEVTELLRLGFAFMISGLLTMGAAYAIRILVLHGAGVDATGLYHAGWTLAGLYVGVVLQAMGTDFYPRLTAAAHDNAAIARLVNEQTQVSVLLAGPGVLATITLAPLLLSGFYSPQFVAAADLLRWLCLGMMLRVVSWPMGYIIVAKGWQGLFIAIEIGAALIHVGLAALLLPRFGVDGAGMAFAALYACHGVAVYIIARRRCGFRFGAPNAKLLATFGAASVLAFASFAVLPFWWATLASGLAAAVGGAFALVALARLTPVRMENVRAALGKLRGSRLLRRWRRHSA